VKNRGSSFDTLGMDGELLTFRTPRTLIFQASRKLQFLRGACRQAAGLSDDLVEGLIEVERSIHAFFIALRNQGVNFQAVSSGSRK
jgi:hypothetical protein